MHRLMIVLLAIVSCANAADIRFRISGEKGLNYLDPPTSLAEGWLTDSTYNVSVRRDGSITKAPGTRIDADVAGADTIVNGMFALNSSRFLAPSSWGLVVAGNVWKKRNLASRAYATLTAPSLLKTGNADDLFGTAFDNEIIGTGDASAIWKFDGESLGILPFDLPQDSSAGSVTTSSGGSLDTSSVYDYFWTWVTSNGNESYSCISLPCTTTATNRKVTLSNLPRYPNSFVGTIDTAQIVGRKIYRMGADGVGRIGDILSVNTTTFVDSGQYPLLTLIDIPPNRLTIQNAAMSAIYRDKLWYVGQDRLTKSGYITNESISTTEWIWKVLPAVPTRLYEFAKVSMRVGNSIGCFMAFGTLTAMSSGTFLLSGEGSFSSEGVLPGDYATVYLLSGNCTSGYLTAKVLSVLSDTAVVLDRDLGNMSNGSNYGIISIGNNIYKIDDEIVAVAEIASGELAIAYGAPTVVGRGMFGTSADSHAIGTPLYRLTPNTLPYLYSSETFNALRIQTQAPIYLPEVPTGVFRGNGFLGIATKTGFTQVTGSRPATMSAVPLVENVGCVARRGLVPYAGGAYTLDQNGEYFISSDGARYLSRSLGFEMRKRSTSYWYTRTTSFYHDGKLYISIPKDATYNCDVWVADLTMDTGDGPPWTVWKGRNYRSFAAWTDADGVTGLYAGDWRRGRIWQVDTDSTSEAGSAMTCQIETPFFNIPGEVPQWMELHLIMETGDSVRVTADFRTRSGTYTSVVQRIFSPNVTTDQTALNQPREFVIPLRSTTTGGGLGIEAEAIQIKIWVYGTEHWVLHPQSYILATRRAR